MRVMQAASSAGMSFECAKQSAVALSHLLDNVNTDYADFLDIVKCGPAPCLEAVAFGAYFFYDV